MKFNNASIFLTAGFAFVALRLYNWIVGIVSGSSIGFNESLITDSLCRKRDAPFGRGVCLQNLSKASEIEAIKACIALTEDMAALGDLEQTNPLKEAMLFEGGLDGLHFLVDKYDDNVRLETECFDAMGMVLINNPLGQARASELGVQGLLVKSARNNIGSRDVLLERVKHLNLQGGLCDECHEFVTESGRSELMMDILRMYINDEEMVENVLIALHMAVHLSNERYRDKFYQLGLPKFGLEIMAAYPTNPSGEWLNIRQRVIGAIVGLCHRNSSQEVMDHIMQLYPAEVLKLMRDEPKDPPSNSRSLEFLNILSHRSREYAQTFVDSGFLDQTKWAMANYTTPNGTFAQYAGQVWNVHQAGARFLENLAEQGHGPEIAKAGVVEVLKKAADNPEGGYEYLQNAARGPACTTLRILSVNYSTCDREHTNSSNETNSSIEAVDLKEWRRRKRSSNETNS